MKIFIKLIKVSVFIFFLVIFPYSNIFGQNSNDSSGINLKLIQNCASNNNSLLNELSSEQGRISKRIVDLQARQEIFAKERDSSNNLTPELLKEAEDLKEQSVILNDQAKDLKKKLTSVSQMVEKKYFDNYYKTTRFIGNSNIDPGSKIFANVCALNGEMNLYGTIKGDIAVINSTLNMQRDSRIEGDIILINSKISANPSARYSKSVRCGEIDQSDEPCNEYGDDNLYSYNFRPKFEFTGTDFTNGPIIRYNRVEGLFLGLSTPKKYYWNGKKKHSFYGSGGYGFANHFWEGNINYDRWIGNEFRSEIGVEGHYLVDSKDNWLISNEENTLSSFLIHEDYKDYYQRAGWSVHFAQYIDKNLRLRVDYLQDENTSMKNNTDYSLFEKNKFFRFNPPIDEGKLHSLIFSLDHITVYGKDYIPTGWNISSKYEIGRGDYDYSQLLVDVRRYQKIVDDLRINMRVMLGSSEKHLPLQRLFEIGGLGSIPATGFKEFAGNRMILGNVEMLFSISDGEDFFPLHILQGNDLVVFYDAGMVDMVDDNLKVSQGFNRFAFNNMQQDIGVALSFGRGSFRIGASFRMDKSEAPKLFIRLMQPF